MAIEWKDSYSVSVKALDDQHRAFIEILNKLYETIKTNKEDEVHDITETLIKYTDIHFKTEEKYFDQFKYEGSSEHKTEHRKLKTKVAEFQKRDEDYLKVAFELADFLENWLVEHLDEMDKKYTKCFNDNGLY